MKIKWFYFIWGIVVIASACRKDKNQQSLYYPTLMEIPQGFPEVEFPEGNEFTYDRWRLGKQLFFDPVMSVDSTVSCASCHLPQLAFSDDKSVSLGVENRLGTRNSPTLANVAYHPYFTREGGVPTLEMQVLVPIQEHNEFDYNIVLLAERLAQISSYVEMAQQAYQRQPDAFVITRALGVFERSLLSGDSHYDRYQRGDETALSVAAKRGMELFFSDRTHCSVCHSGFNFTNYAFQNNGLYEEYPDVGRFRLTGDTADIALFKVPSLRNIALTAPYMHDGNWETLQDVVEHYNQGGESHIHKSEYIYPLQLTTTEKNDLVQFLQALTDDAFISNPLFAK